MPIITIEYSKKRHDQERVVVVYIDGSKVGEIDVGETIEFEVAAAKHTLLLKSKRRGVAPSIEIDMSDNRDQFIKVLNPRTAEKITFGGIIPIIIISALMREILNIESSLQAFLYLYIPIIIIYALIVRGIDAKFKHLDVEITN